MSQDEARRSAIAKAGRRLLPFLCLCYAVNFLDRVNVGFAALAMNDDLGFSPSVYGFGAGIFFAGYILFEVPSNLALQQIRRAHLDRAHHDQLGPGRHRHGVRQRRAELLCAALPAWASPKPASSPASSSISPIGFRRGNARASSRCSWRRCRSPRMVGGPVSGALLEMHGLLGLKGWQWLFIVEGLPAVILGVIALKFLDDRPERRALAQPGRADGARRHARGARPKPREKPAMPSSARRSTRPRVLVLGFLYFCIVIGFYGVELLDAAGDPDLWANSAPDRLPHRHTVLLRRRRHGGLRARIPTAPASASGTWRCRCWLPAWPSPGRPTTLPLWLDHGGADPRHGRDLCRDRHILVAADLDPDGHAAPRRGSR